ncbi:MULTISPECIES: hypothetical protein [unclassified Bradyrhizobium]|uniref:hypothetical protein n=1 Tax=unclassified Bradyrhizobium TaxID=2631580 RepID=UPI00291658EA|nr:MULTISPECIES: hypothetical protein [unclassified Bradyrhizobium]
MLLACGWNNERIAGALRITEPTLRKHYFSELESRDVARDRLNAALLMKGYEAAQAGSATAIRMFLQLVDRNDLMMFGQPLKPSSAKKPEKPAKAEKVGKKAAALAAAHQPDAGSPMGELMARRLQGMN